MLIHISALYISSCAFCTNFSTIKFCTKCPNNPNSQMREIIVFSKLEVKRSHQEPSTLDRSWGYDSPSFFFFFCDRGTRRYPESSFLAGKSWVLLSATHALSRWYAMSVVRVGSTRPEARLLLELSLLGRLLRPRSTDFHTCDRVTSSSVHVCPTINCASYGERSSWIFYRSIGSFVFPPSNFVLK